MAGSRSGPLPLLIDPVTTLDEVAEQLRGWRVAAGSPSYTEIVRRVRRQRSARGLPDSEQPGRITVYDCFRSNRRRLDIDLVVDIGRALGLDDAQAREWERVCWSVRHRVEAARIVTVRHGLPSRVRHFVGRSTELSVVAAACARDASRPVVAITGMAGCGKTQLAIHAAGRIIDDGGAAQAVFVDLRGFDPSQPPADPHAVLEAVLHLLGVGHPQLPAGPAERRALLGDRLAATRTVLVLDDAAGPEQAESVVPDAGTSPVLVTSRAAPCGDLAATHVPLGVFAADDTVELLRRTLGDARVNAEPDAVVDIAQAIGQLPLAAGIVVSRIAALPSWTLRDHRDALSTRHEHLRLDDSLRAAFELSYRALAGRTRRALRLLAAQPCPDLGFDSLAALLGCGVDAAGAVADELIRAHVALEPAPGRIGLHTLVRAHATAASHDEDRPADRDAAVAALFDHLVSGTWAAVRACYPAQVFDQRHPTGSRGPEAGMEQAARWLATEHENLLTVSHPEHGRIRATLAVELSEALSKHLERRGQYRDGLILHGRALDAAREAGDRCGEGRAELNLGSCHVRLAEYERGTMCLERAGRILSESGDTASAMAAKNSLAIVAAQTGDLAGALHRFQDALATARSLGMTGSLATVLDNIAIIMRRLGDLDGALQHHRLAHEHAAEQGDRTLVAASLMNMSEVHLLKGSPEAALESATMALDRAEELGSVPVQAYALTNIGMALVDLERVSEAIDRHESALALAREIENRNLEAGVLNNLGMTSIARHEWTDAAKWFNEARIVAEQIADDFERARCLDGLARIALNAGDAATARLHWEESLALFQASGTPEAAAVRRSLEGLDGRVG